ncbi:hypothetical protein KAJ02_09350, partial [Candidatus Bipolaricaulota bacterium]|nr:hypothetical protein [Candidatus Bipolaricaulota bacterium]
EFRHSRNILDGWRLNAVESPSFHTQFPLRLPKDIPIGSAGEATATDREGVVLAAIRSTHPVQGIGAEA